MTQLRIEPAACLIDGKLQAGTSIVIEAGKIIQLGQTTELARQYPHAVVDPWPEMAVVPGTINAHNHSFQSLLRGIAADRPFLEWRDESLYRYSPRLRVHDIYVGALFAFCEMMKCGVTTVCDFFYLHNDGTAGDEAVIQAAHDAGIRLVLARTMYDWTGAPKGYVETVSQAMANTESLMKKYSGGMAKVIPAPHSLHAASPEMIQAGWDLAHRYQTPFHIHVAEEPFEVEQVRKMHGTTPLRYLHQLGVVDDSMCIIHGVWLEKEEIQLLGQLGGQLIYCPSSNMFLADGVTDIPTFLQHGINISLGSDGACGNNRISVLEEMRMVSILQKAHTLNALCVNYKDAFRMGTTGGSKSLDLPVGQLVPGRAADLVGISLKDLSMQPLSRSEQFLPNMVYSLQPTAIRRVMINGRVTVDNGRLQLLEDRQLLEQIQATMAYLEA
jgi:5-methylthioadenosine/S-adenosylhomocysteine deaminase